MVVYATREVHGRGCEGQFRALRARTVLSVTIGETAKQVIFLEVFVTLNAESRCTGHENRRLRLAGAKS